MELTNEAMSELALLYESYAQHKDRATLMDEANAQQQLSNIGVWMTRHHDALQAWWQSEVK